MTDNRTATELHLRVIDELTDDLLQLADVFEEHQVNVKLGNGRYLNPASAIRNKVDIIWDETLAMATLGSGECEAIHDTGYYRGINGICEGLYCSKCGEPLSSKFGHCPWCGAKIKAVKR